MEFTLCGPDKLKVILTEDDLISLNTDYHSLDRNNPDTRKILLRLLSQGKEAGFSPKKSKLYIELFPREEGGCVVYFTRLSGGEVTQNGRLVPGPAPTVFAFKDTGALLDCCARAHSLYSHRILRSSLYLLGDEYRLIVYPLDFCDNLSVSFIGEYARLVGEGTLLAAYIDEHGKLLREDNALETLAQVEGGGSLPFAQL